MMEFKKIPMLHNLYEISADGKHFRRVSTCKELKISEGVNYGYSQVVVTVNKRYPEEDILRSHPKAFESGVHADGSPVHQLTLKVHQLVYNAWVGEVPDGMVIDHIDRNRHNNSVENLRAVEIRFNAQNREEKTHIFGCWLCDEVSGERMYFDTKVKAIDYVSSLLKKSRRTVYNAFYGAGRYKNFVVQEPKKVGAKSLLDLERGIDDLVLSLPALCKGGKVRSVREACGSLCKLTSEVSKLRLG